MEHGHSDNMWHAVHTSHDDGRNAFVLKARTHAARGRTYSATVMQRIDLTCPRAGRPGFIDINVGLVDGVVKCTNVVELQRCLDEVINAAIVDFQALVKEGGIPRAFKPKDNVMRTDAGGPTTVRGRTKSFQRKLELTPEQRVERRRVASSKQAAAVARNVAIRNSMKGGAGRKA
jgi:hypothetical protein